MKKHSFDFVGDYLFDEARRDEKYTTLAHITKTCVTRYQNSRGDAPKRLILFRNGMSEGQFATAKQYEIPMVRLALQECSASSCKLTVLVSQKVDIFWKFCLNKFIFRRIIFVFLRMKRLLNFHFYH